MSRISPGRHLNLEFVEVYHRVVTRDFYRQGPSNREFLARKLRAGRGGSGLDGQIFLPMVYPDPTGPFLFVWEMTDAGTFSKTPPGGRFAKVPDLDLFDLSFNFPTPASVFLVTWYSAKLVMVIPVKKTISPGGPPCCPLSC